MRKFKALLVSLGILMLIFVSGFVGINIIMKIAVGHGNEIEVPDLTGVDFNVALKQCADLNLYLEQKEFIHNDEVERGKIISQDPHPNIKTKKFRTIKVVVSEGPEMVRIPFLENLSITEAKLRLENVGLYLGEKKYRYSDEVEKDKIIYSQPPADDLIARKSDVQVVVSLGRLTNSSERTDHWKDLLDNN